MSCQGFINEQTKMVSAFKATMAKLAVVGHDPQSMVDCSDVIPMNPLLRSPLRHYLAVVCSRMTPLIVSLPSRLEGMFNRHALSSSPILPPTQAQRRP